MFAASPDSGLFFLSLTGPQKQARISARFCRSMFISTRNGILHQFCGKQSFLIPIAITVTKTLAICGLRLGLWWKVEPMRTRIITFLVCASLVGCGSASHQLPSQVERAPPATTRLTPPAAAQIYVYGRQYSAGPVIIGDGYEAAISSPPTPIIGTLSHHRTQNFHIKPQTASCDDATCLDQLVSVLMRYCTGQGMSNDDLSLLYNSDLAPNPPGSKSQCPAGL